MAWAKCAVLATAFVATVSSGGRAQSNDLQTELAHCLSFSGAVERLSCYDRLARDASRALPQNSAAAPIPSMPSRADTAVNRAPPQDFGREQLRTVPLPGEDRMTGQIANFQEDSTGRFTIELNNGQVWQQTPGDTARAPSRLSGTKTVVISRGSLGSYDLTFSGRNMTFKVKRLR